VAPAVDCVNATIARQCENDMSPSEQSRLAVTMQQYGIVVDLICRDNVDGNCEGFIFAYYYLYILL